MGYIYTVEQFGATRTPATSVRGVYATAEEAQDAAEKLNSERPGGAADMVRYPLGTPDTGERFFIDDNTPAEPRKLYAVRTMAGDAGNRIPGSAVAVDSLHTDLDAAKRRADEIATETPQRHPHVWAYLDGGTDGDAREWVCNGIPSPKFPKVGDRVRYVHTMNFATVTKLRHCTVTGQPFAEVDRDSGSGSCWDVPFLFPADSDPREDPAEVRAGNRVSTLAKKVQHKPL